MVLQASLSKLQGAEKLSGTLLSVSIFGSCVSRDAFALDTAATNFRLAGYIARSSFASQSCAPWIDEDLLSGISSDFQRRMVRADLEKTLFTSPILLQSDVLLIDLIDDRFDLVEFRPGCFATASSEFVRGLKNRPRGRIIRSASKEFFELWKRGVQNFVQFLDAQRKTNKLLINRVFWAECYADGSPIDGVDAGSIARANAGLQKKYEFLENILGSKCFIDYSKELLVADREHKWGLSPFHFVQNLYLHTLLELDRSKSRSDPLAVRAQDLSGKDLAEIPRSIYISKLSEACTPQRVAEGDLIISKAEWAAPGFSASYLGAGIDWVADPFGSRTWGWHLHQFSFMISLIAYDRARGGSSGCELAVRMAQDWADKFTCDRTHQLAWHDHGTALRARNMLLLRQHILEKRTDHADEVAFVDIFLNVHLEALADEIFYSRGTNHGLDQSLVLLELVMELGLARKLTKVLETAVRRVQFEVGKAIAADGGHIENSCGYLNYGLKQAIEAAAIGHHYFPEKNPLAMDATLLDKATMALAFMIRPDGTLPIIGDTAYFEVRDFLAAHFIPSYPYFKHAISRGRHGVAPAAQSHHLPVSGWAMVRASAGADANYLDSLHMVFKCGFLSTYHRQDDDLHFVLCAFREDWLIDAGLFKHEPKHPMRVHVRSAAAHNISSPLGVRAHRNLNLVHRDWRISRLADTGGSVEIEASTGMFAAYSSSRHLILNREELSLFLRDEIQCADDQELLRLQVAVDAGAPTHVTRFLAPKNKLVRVDRARGLVRLIGQRHELVIKGPATAQKIVVKTGVQSPRLAGWTSLRAGEIEEAHCIEFYHCARHLTVDFHLFFKHREGVT
jgi:Family of unknown function (DUF6270)/Heparinase II/III-like protein/Heparinase II/III N-terminus